MRSPRVNKIFPLAFTSIGSNFGYKKIKRILEVSEKIYFLDSQRAKLYFCSSIIFLQIDV